MFSWLQKKDRIDKSNICTRIVESLDDAVIVLDKEFQIQIFNKMAEEIFGYKRDDMIGEHFNNLIPQRFRLQHDLMVAEFAAGGSGNNEEEKDQKRAIMGLHRDGSEFQTTTSIIRLRGGSDPIFAAIIRDVSEKKKNEEELLKLASTDPLTGAFNRREFTSLAERECQRSRRYDRPLSILMCDIDHFKNLNDTYGHAAGDKALQKFTTICCNALRNVDIFGRWGGEEFVALLPETDGEEAGVIAERLRKMVEEGELIFNDHKIKFTVSIGIGQFREGESTLEGPLSRADAAVYDAKKAGRNSVALYKDA